MASPFAVKHRKEVARCLLVLPAVLLASLLLAQERPARAQAPTDATQVIVDGADVGRSFGGVGAISQGASSRLLIDYPEPERSQILDYLFKPGYGASLQLLKVGIGGDSNATDGSDPSHMRSAGSVDCNRGWKWWIMEEAKKRNPDIKLLAQGWSAPSWIGGYWTEKSIDYQLAWLDCAKQHGLKIDYFGAWNEQGFEKEGVVAFADAVKEQYPDVKVPGGDERGGSWAIADSMAEHPRLKEAVDVVNVHSPCTWRSHYRNCSSPEVARKLGTPLWLAANAAEGWDVGGASHVRAFNRMYIDAKMTGYMTWNLVESRYGNLPLGNTGLMGANWPWSGYYQLGKNIWAFAHTTQFTEPGWHYLNSGSKRLDDEATVVSLASPSGQEYSMILEAMDLKRPDVVFFQLKNLPERPLQVWTTNMASGDASDYFQHVGTIVPHDGRFRLAIRPNHMYSITSTTGQGKGHARPSASIEQQLSLPYREDFENVKTGKMAPLFTSINGAFEVRKCKGGRTGLCYQQAVSQKPFEWNDTGKMPPTTLVGNPRWWGDYTVSADVMLEKQGYVELVGRVTGQLGWTPYLGGYHLQVGSGGWKLYSEDPPSRNRDTLARGPQGIAPGMWHKVVLRMRADRLDVLLDGRRLVRLSDTKQLSGNAALRAGTWQQVQFDDVSVEATGSPPDFVSDEEVSVAGASSAREFYHGWTFEPDNVIDERLGTAWQSKKKPMPHSLTLDVGEPRSIQALWVRPRRPYFKRDHPVANITEYRVEVSRDGRAFETAAEGTWPASGSAKLAVFDRPRTAQFVRLVALKTTDGQAAASEVRIITKLPSEWKSVEAAP